MNIRLRLMGETASKIYKLLLYNPKREYSSDQMAQMFGVTRAYVGKVIGREVEANLDITRRREANVIFYSGKPKGGQQA